MGAEKIARYRPEIAAGGFSRYDGAVEFFTRVNSLLQPHFDVLDLGAGRGGANDDKCNYRRSLRVLRGKVRRIVGADVDQAVSTNPIVDDYRILEIGKPIPFPDASFDIILCEWVVEHIDDPESFQTEVSRLTRPGGWFCARTPNRWGLTAIVARLIPNRLHTKVLKHMQPARKEYDVFPTRYRLNTMGEIARRFPSSEWENASYPWMGDPKYHANNPAIWLLMTFWNWIMPNAFATDIFIFLRRK